MALHELGQVHISTDAFDEALAFYRDALGLPVEILVPEQGMAFFRLGATRLYLSHPADDAFRSRPVLYLTCDDIDAEVAVLAARGVRFVDEPHLVHRGDEHELWLAFFEAPDGLRHAVMEQRAA
ncbi:MAG: glyoxalase/bleomycin resistance/dioxygenase family protein [Frankiales bacterium]|nr:glyoxalase/bleomycin resistance/dioxygenase family protein [Frankiales bacterium]